MNDTGKIECIKIMCRVSSAHMILPKSYHLSTLYLHDVPTPFGDGFAKICEGKHLSLGRVCVKVFEDQPTSVLEKMKEVCDSVRPESERNLITIRSSIL